jgi:hypothetical protein
MFKTSDMGVTTLAAANLTFTGVHAAVDHCVGHVLPIMNAGLTLVQLLTGVVTAIYVVRQIRKMAREEAASEAKKTV